MNRWRQRLALSADLAVRTTPIAASSWRHHRTVKTRRQDFAALCSDLEAALRQLTSGVERDASLWTRGRLGRWTAGQQIAHVGLAIALMAEPFEVAAQALGAGVPP